MIGLCNEEKNIFSFITYNLDWNDIEWRIIDYYCLDEKIGNMYYLLGYGITDCVIYTKNNVFEFEMGILNLSDNEWLVTIYPNKLIKNDFVKNKTLNKNYKTK